MNNTQRPLSPHLQVYKPQLTSMLSILHRITGLLLSLGMLVFIYWLFQLVNNPVQADAIIGFFKSGFGQFLTFAWVFTFFYHLCNGIRHLFWDIGKGISIPAVYRSGYLVLFMAVVLTALIFLLAR
ncbi:succinate dehydrogenase, cytochrome b556 subunit [Marinicella sp. S1101]|uniref:succinate dehydrogenase, cytochrome b556 subunit n=1 Tax=Marinicella marina TaxID=2996016 RepID=UPI0022609F0C|nr:succinate dehydrogenase, cytochrome b556 subunit [Marinicella marina]MCX7554459.1 succinate dehydrogenase, cytochrome b556 subunit [Marinicella marina]MDJ1140610.1 succinate dehydrogenase, cytochrome b556 subunit [Marinicella marina]